MDVREIQDFIEWYWREIDGRPSRDTSLTIAYYYLDDKLIASDSGGSKVSAHCCASVHSEQTSIKGGSVKSR